MSTKKDWIGRGENHVCHKAIQFTKLNFKWQAAAFQNIVYTRGWRSAVAPSSYIGNCINCYTQSQKILQKYGYLNSTHFMLKSISEKFKWSISIEWCPSFLGQFLLGEDTNGKKGNMRSSIFSLVTKLLNMF